MKERKIDGETRLVCLLGKPARHSISPKIHNMTFDIENINYKYLVFEPENLEDAIKGLKSLGAVGFNLTMPYKIEAIKYLDQLDEVSKLCNSVNTVKIEDGKLIGYSTDGDGLLESIRGDIDKFVKPKIVLLGSGGASSSIGASLYINTNADISVYARRVNEYLPSIVDSRFQRKLFSDKKQFIEDIRLADIIINATSVGMKDDASLIEDTSILNPKQVVVDIVYEPEETKLYKDAKSVGCKVYNGYNMLMYQANLAFKIWTGKEFDVELTREVLFTKY